MTLLPTPEDGTPENGLPDDTAADLTAAFEALRARQPDAVALHHPVRNGRYAELTYRQLTERCDAYTGALSHAGLRPGMRTCLMVPPGPDLAALVLALARLGVVPVLIDPGIARSALRRCLAEAAPDAFIGVPKAHAGRVLLGWARRSVRLPVTVGRRWFWRGPTLRALCAAAPDIPPPRADRSPDDLAAIAFTSGSTGVPKAVEYRARHLGAQLRLAREAFPLEPGTVGISTFPPFALAGPALGLTLVVPRMDPIRPASADPAVLVAEIGRFGASGLFGAPALLDSLSRYCADRALVLEPLRFVTSAGASLDPRTAERLRRCLPEDALLHSAYGATECLPLSVIESRELLGETRLPTERGHGVCVGRPLAANTVRVITVSDGPIPLWSDDLLAEPGAVGEITVAGPAVSERYFGRPQETALAKIREGDRIVHRMGDLGRLDEQGRLWLCGRTSQRVRTPDGDLCTEQVEPIANTVPGVRRSALVGVGAPGAQTPVLCVEAERGIRRSQRPGVAAEVLDRFAGYPHTAAIRQVLFHPGFPVDIRHNAKIGRERLARWAAGRLR
ncbi:fatty acid CoA ligase family protein [Peterkaempfera bronchialis]|uniref:fatty acid CoA ligase family protein n=1 Tax=Peterkaempfera bronchialis TaxID=2126346 RepID=UPI003C2CDFF6